MHQEKEDEDEKGKRIEKWHASKETVDRIKSNLGPLKTSRRRRRRRGSKSGMRQKKALI